MQIFVLPQKEALSFAKKNKLSHIISISDPGVISPFDSGWSGAEVLSLKFFDVTSEEVAKKMKESEIPTQEMIKNIYHFGKSFDEDSNILIHCMAGISRSPAAGIISLTSQFGAIGASKIIGSLNYGGEIGYKRFFPNNLMIQHFDDLLHFDGEFFDLIGDAYFK